MQELLRKIVAGQKIFEPTGDSDAELRDFQRVASLLLKAEGLGYLRDVLPHQESESGNDYYDTVAIGGITQSGRQLAE